MNKATATYTHFRTWLKRLSDAHGTYTFLGVIIPTISAVWIAWLGEVPPWGLILIAVFFSLSLLGFVPWVIIGLRLLRLTPEELKHLGTDLLRLPEPEVKIVSSEHSWLADVVKADSQRPAASVHQLEPRQHANVEVDIKDKLKPSIQLRLSYVNASVYTLQVTDVKGSIQLQGQALPGWFDFQPFNIARNVKTLVELKFALHTEASVNTIQEIITIGKPVWFDLGTLRLTVVAVEDESIAPSDVAIPDQQWRPSRTRTSLKAN
jgi:hypothetical protein